MPNGHVLDTTEETRSKALYRPGQLDIAKAFGDLAKQHAQFEACEVCAEAETGASRQSSAELTLRASR